MKKLQKPLKRKKSLVDKLMYPYRVVVHDEINFAGKWSFHITLARIFVYSFLILMFFAGLSIFFILNFSGKKGIQTDRAEYEQLLETVEYLEEEIEKRDNFLADFQKSLRGEQLPQPNMKQDSAFKPLDPDEEQLNKVDSSELALRSQFENRNTDKNPNANERNIYLFPPVTGVVSRGFLAKERHFAIDIVTKKDEAIKATADGVVIISTWTREAGYVLGIQHPNQMISFYKHNSVLRKEVGDVVKAGDIVAVVGNSGELTDGPHLHFELWYKGSPIDPQNFISF